MNSNRKRVFVLVLVLLALASVSLAACVRPGTPVASGGGGGGGGGVVTGGTEVHMGAVNFVQETVTISKGSKLTLIDDVQVLHIIKNGTWANGTAKDLQEPGAPAVNHTFNGSDSADIGPFTTAGTFQLYCTVHSGMNLTVTVK